MNATSAKSFDEQNGHNVNSTALLLTPEQAATSLAICRTKIFELLRLGELESVQIGTSRRIPVRALEEYVRRLRQRHPS